MKPKFSVIIPTFNEEAHGFLPQILNLFSAYAGDVEVIVSDSGSHDNTLELAQKFGARLIHCSDKSRAQRINKGVLVASCDLILVNHPRSVLEASAIEYLINNSDLKGWGAFTHSFDTSHPLLRFASWYSNNIRSKLAGIVYLDHCIYFRKQDYIPIPDVDIFEDTLLSKALIFKIGKPTLKPFLSTTSAVRFVKNGIWKQALLNQYLKLMFLMKGDHSKMNRLYEKNVDLNNKYD